MMAPISSSPIDRLKSWESYTTLADPPTLALRHPFEEVSVQNGKETSKPRAY